MVSIALRLLTLTIGAVFIFLGQLHLTPQLLPEQHNQIKNEYGKFNKEFPLHRQTGWRPYAKNYRLAVGITELVCGAMLILGFFQSLATIVLLMIMTNAIITLQKLNYSLEWIGGSIFLSFMLVLRLVLVSRSKAVQVVRSAKSKIEKKAQ